MGAGGGAASEWKGHCFSPQGTRCPWTCPLCITTARCCGTPCPSWATASTGTSSRTARGSAGWVSSDTTSQVTQGTHARRVPIRPPAPRPSPQTDAQPPAFCGRRCSSDRFGAPAGQGQQPWPQTRAPYWPQGWNWWELGMVADFAEQGRSAHVRRCRLRTGV